MAVDAAQAAQIAVDDRDLAVAEIIQVIDRLLAGVAVEIDADPVRDVLVFVVVVEQADDFFQPDELVYERLGVARADENTGVDAASMKILRT